MADHADDGDDDSVFIYMGGNQVVPGNVRYVRVHKSVKIITRWAFLNCRNLVSIEMHDGVEIIECRAFWDCSSLRGIKLPGVRVIEKFAFYFCTALEDAEFGKKLETIGEWAFQSCTSLRIVKIPKVRSIETSAFAECHQLTGVELSEDLETVEDEAFDNCRRLRRITLPLKDNLLADNVFNNWGDLSQVDIIGGIHNTISSLLLGSWKDEINDEINQINQDLPNTPTIEKTAAIRQWMERVRGRMDHCKSEHYALLKNNITQLELALWKSGLSNIDADAGRHEARVTCGANVIIPHVLSFLNDDEVFPTVRAIPL